MSFIESPRFPDIIALGSSGGPEYVTSVVVVSSGKEYKKQRWTYPKHRYQVGAGAKGSIEIDELRVFHHAMRGRFNGFRFKDFNDYSSAANMATAVSVTDQVIGTGDGTTTEFQLYKNYITSDSPSLTLQRKITKPVSGTVLIGLSNDSPILQTEGADYTVDYTTGIVTFNTAPGAGTSPLGTPTIYAGFQFDVPVRFESDTLQVQQISPGIEQASIGMVEIL